MVGGQYRCHYKLKFLIMAIPDRIYAQYRNRTKAVQWLGITAEISDELDTVYRTIQKMYDIDTNVGAQLDIIGNLVQINRSFQSQVIFDPDQFGGDGGEEFGGPGFQFKPDASMITANASDSLFRLILKAKIAKNNSDATIDSIIGALKFVTSQQTIFLVDNEDMTFSISFKSELTSDERFILDNFDVVPKPQGVEFTGYTEEFAITEFGGGLSFGDPRAEFTPAL